MFVASNSLWITLVFAIRAKLGLLARCNLLGCASSRCGNHGAELIINVYFLGNWVTSEKKCRQRSRAYTDTTDVYKAAR